MKSPMVRVPKPNVLETLVFVYETVANDLNLRLMRDRLQVRMQDGAFRIQSLSVAVRAASLGVKPLGNLELCFWGRMSLVLKHKNLMLKKRISYKTKVVISKLSAWAHFGWQPKEGVDCIEQSRMETIDFLVRLCTYRIYG